MTTSNCSASVDTPLAVPALSVAGHSFRVRPVSAPSQARALLRRSAKPPSPRLLSPSQARALLRRSAKPPSPRLLSPSQARALLRRSAKPPSPRLLSPSQARALLRRSAKPPSPRRFSRTGEEDLDRAGGEDGQTGDRGQKDQDPRTHA